VSMSGVSPALVRSLSVSRSCCATADIRARHLPSFPIRASANGERASRPFHREICFSSLLSWRRTLGHKIMLIHESSWER
jgi:hypothetical protein